MVGVASFTGFFVGVAAVLFKWAILAVYDLCYDKAIGIEFGQWSLELLWIPVVLAVGGLIVGILNHYLNPAGGTGSVAEVMKWAAVDQGKISSRVIWFRPLASAITIGTGGSAGREGPIVQVGAAIGSWVGKRIKASSERIRLLAGCGAAAAIAAAFNAPLGGIIFSIELILGDFNIKVFSPLIFASVIATVTARHMEGNVPAFQIPQYFMVSAWEIIFFVILGLLCGLLAALFYRVYFIVCDRVKKLKVHPILLPALGGMVVGIIAILFPDILGNGYGSMDKVLTGKMAWSLALALIFIKIIATSITIGSKGSGGKFAPALFIGSMAGGVFGAGVNFFFPDITGPPGGYALVGMGAVMSAVAHAPLTNILMVFELTDNYQVIAPIMVACISATFMYSYFFSNSIYIEELRLRGVSIWGGRESSIMSEIKIKDVMTKKFETIPEDMPFKKILNLISRSKEMYFPCVDEKGRMTGVISLQDLREIMFESDLADLVVAKELAQEKVISLYPDENLNDAMERFAIKDLDELPVVSRHSANKILGILKRKDVISAYKKAIFKTSI
ncbi:MAG: chloride channel protein [bacterium]|nr:MAG: chloride channel protein [bacterium]